MRKIVKEVEIWEDIIFYLQKKNLSNQIVL